jgi:hypothetical protein
MGKSRYAPYGLRGEGGAASYGSGQQRRWVSVVGPALPARERERKKTVYIYKVVASTVKMFERLELKNYWSDFEN